METMYYTTRQTTTSGTALDTKSVTGRDKEEAILNAKIKAYKAMETFKNESTMIDAYVNVSDLETGTSYVSEHWEAVTAE